MLHHFDGFDHYTTVSQRYIGVAQALATSGGRNGNGVRSQGASFSVPIILPSSQEWYTGFAWFPGNAGDTHSFRNIIAFRDGTTLHTDLRINDTGRLFVTRNGTTVGPTGTTVLAFGVYYYIELYMKIDDSAGAFEIRINGATEASGTGLDTRNGASAVANDIRLVNSAGGSIETRYDDWYICDASGSAPYNTFLGDVKVETIFPNGNGNTSGMTGSDGNSTDNYLLVDETAPNSDTDYVQSASVGTKDTYAMGNLATTSGTVLATMPVPFARKSDAGSRQIYSVARLSGTEEDSAAKTLLDSYTYLPDIRTTKPGGGAWTIADVNSAEFGPKVAA